MFGAPNQSNGIAGLRKLDVVKMAYVGAETLTWEELLDGFEYLKVITFSSGINFVDRILRRFKTAEIIFGYGMLTGTPRKECLKAAIDAGMLQKLLPKLHGSLNRLGPVLDALIGKVSKAEKPTNDPDAPAEIQKIYPLTYEKLQRMKDRVEKNGFTSFAEA